MSDTRYAEPRDRSAELLRLALAQMGTHPAALNPLTFTVWYEHIAGFNPKLSHALKAHLEQSQPIDDAMIVALFEQYVAPAGEAAMTRFGSEMGRLMKTMSAEASSTGKQAGLYGHQLSGLSAALASKDVKQLVPRITEVIAGTATMQDVASALEKRVADSQQEIERLRTELDRAVGEALVDPLSGILNRRGFDQTLNLLLADAADAEPGHCLVILDLDHFKNVNDTHGHLVGDRVIRAMGEILRSSITSPLHAVARYGGEEFAIIARRTPKERCVELTETIRSRTKAMKFRDRNTNDVILTVSVSAGLTELRPGDDAASAIARADAALYASKAAGRDRLTCA